MSYQTKQIIITRHIQIWIESHDARISIFPSLILWFVFLSPIFTFLIDRAGQREECAILYNLPRTLVCDISLFGRVCSPKINQDENLTGVISFDCSPDVHGLRRNLAWSMIGPKSHALQNSISSQLDGAKEINSSKRFGIWNLALTTWLFTTGVLALYFLRRAYYKQVISKTAPPRFRRNSIFLNPDTLMDQSFLLCLETS